MSDLYEPMKCARLYWDKKAADEIERLRAELASANERANRLAADCNALFAAGSKKYSEIAALRAELDAATGMLASLADTVAGALRNTNMSDEGIGLSTDLRDHIWSLSYKANGYRIELDAAKAEVEELTNDSQRICGENHDYALRVLKLEAELDAARRDAERYRWLRTRINWSEEYLPYSARRTWTHCDYRLVRPDSEHIDEYIDAAMKEPKP